MRTSASTNIRTHLARLGVILAVPLVLASCGLGDEDEDPTEVPTEQELESQSQPTETPADGAASTPDDPFVLVPSSPVASPSPGSDAAATPDVPGPTTPAATEDVLAATAETSQADPAASPAGSAAGADAAPTMTPNPNAVTGSDGTSGASPFATPVRASGGTPVASSGTGEGLVVETCDVVEAPPYTGDSTAYVTVEEVNFRVGPGSDCDPLLDGPLNVDVSLTVLSDPVTRIEDDGESDWLQVDVEGTVGWIAAEFVAPADTV